ncbi:GumC family protein [Rhodopseudomonas sp. HC1]|uniref:GumC family protein n=1 Tax=Rhodopseudomonas infernalis TaxID=2897386 RepID=UPI001EE8F404|nr:GumC family protein [Rhodopseudomonas infernalis]MCG6203122.1 GumC family protein [Rhodopseudomonas infernalis]
MTNSSTISAKMADTMPVANAPENDRSVRPSSLGQRRVAELLNQSGFEIAAAVVVCLALAFAYLLFSTPKYTASARILLDPTGLQIVGTDLATPGGRDTNSIEAESQVYVITSGDVLAGVIAKEKLDTNRYFGTRPRGLLSSVLVGLGVLSPIEPHMMALRELERAVTVSRNANSFVITINVQTEDRDTSARIANAITDVYLQDQARAQAETARRTAAALDARLGALQLRLHEAEERYETYRRENGIVIVNGQPLLEQQARDSAGFVSVAEQKVTELRSALEQIRKAGGGDLDNLPEAFRGGSLETLKNRYAAARQAETNISALLGPRHPDMVTAASQTAEARQLLTQAIQSAIQSTVADLDRARSTAAGLKLRLGTTTRELDASNEASVKLRELGRDVEASRRIYEAFLNRSRELTERERLDASNARVISRATRPIDPNGPPALLIIFASIILGLGLGVTWAWVRGQFLGPAAAIRKQ